MAEITARDQETAAALVRAGDNLLGMLEAMETHPVLGVLNPELPDLRRRWDEQSAQMRSRFSLGEAAL